MTLVSIYLALQCSHLSGEASLGSVGQGGVQAVGHASFPTFLVFDLKDDSRRRKVCPALVLVLLDTRFTSLMSSAASLARCVSMVAGMLEYAHVLSSFFPASLYLSCRQTSSTSRLSGFADV